MENECIPTGFKPYLTNTASPRYTKQLSMKRSEKIITGFILGGAFPLLLGLLSLLLWFSFDKNESRAFFYVLSGFLLGFIVDIVFLKKWIDRRYELPVWFIAGIYLFYNICIYGMFMGFPVFNVAMGVVAGYYYGNRMYYNNTLDKEQHKLIQQVSLFTGLVMVVFCMASGIIALGSNSVGSEVRSMLGLGFEITRPMLWGITIIGGIFLVWLQVMVTRITMKMVLKSY